MRSAPAQNIRPSPLTMTTLQRMQATALLRSTIKTTYQRLDSSSNQLSTLSMSLFMVGETAFSALGRLRVNSMTWSCGKATLISFECAGGCRAFEPEVLLIPMSLSVC